MSIEPYDKDYVIEEADDPRTWGLYAEDAQMEIAGFFGQESKGTQLVIKDYYAKKKTKKSKKTPASSIEEMYWDCFKAILDACGKTNYYGKTFRYLQDNHPKSQQVADEYEHNLRYYEEKYRYWWRAAKQAYDDFEETALSLNKTLGVVEKIAYLKSVLDNDRREYYRNLMSRCKRDKVVLSLTEIEQRYQDLQRKRAAKHNKT